MATLTETSVTVEILMARIQGTPRMRVTAVSRDAEGAAIRTLSWDVTDNLTDNQRTTLENIVALAETKAKANMGIA